jgi:hypothetical protein
LRLRRPRISRQRWRPCHGRLGPHRHQPLPNLQERGDSPFSPRRCPTRHRGIVHSNPRCSPLCQWPHKHRGNRDNATRSVGLKRQSAAPQSRGLTVLDSMRLQESSIHRNAHTNNSGSRSRHCWRVSPRLVGTDSYFHRRFIQETTHAFFSYVNGHRFDGMFPQRRQTEHPKTAPSVWPHGSISQPTCDNDRSISFLYLVNCAADLVLLVTEQSMEHYHGVVHRPTAERCQPCVLIRRAMSLV